mmetsp:Transcript_64950/g.171403  ORF Transcript_64950/g.171403 Transcript_64950/m.171403 type:complete len:148 (+) Transcript_64950:63-506(+)
MSPRTEVNEPGCRSAVRKWDPSCACTGVGATAPATGTFGKVHSDSSDRADSPPHAAVQTSLRLRLLDLFELRARFSPPRALEARLLEEELALHLFSRSKAPVQLSLLVVAVSEHLAPVAFRRVASLQRLYLLRTERVILDVQLWVHW